MHIFKSLDITKNTIPVLFFTGASWLLLVSSISYYCYLYGLVYTQNDDFSCYIKWGLWSCAIWLVLIPVIFKTIETNNQPGKPVTFLTQCYMVAKLGVLLCTIAIVVQLVGTLVMGNNIVQDVYYYFPTNIKIFIMTSLMAYVFVNKKNLQNENCSSLDQESIDCLNHNNQNISIEINDIDWLTTYGNYVQVNSDGHLYLKRVTMKEMELKLNNSQFARIHRSHIVNKNIIDSIVYKSGKNTLKTVCGTFLPIGRSYKNNIKSKILTN